MRCGHRAAVAFFDQALSAAEHLPRNQRIIERESDLSQLLHGSLFPLGELRRLGDQLSVTAKLAAETGDHVRLVRASTSEAHWGWVTGQPEKAIKSAERARLLAEATGNDFVKRTSGYFLGQAQHLHGDFARCIEVLTAASKDPETELERPPGPVMADYDLYALAWLAMAHAELGNFRLAIAAGSEAVERGERRGNTYGLFHGCMGLGIALLLNGDVARAIPPLERGRSIAEAAELPLIRYAIEVHLASAYSLGGRLADGQALLEQAVTYLDSVGFLAFGPFAASQLSELYLRCGRTDDAIRLAHRARDLTLECHQRGYHAWTLRLLGEIDASLQTTAVPEAEGHYFDAMKSGRELGMRPLIAHCHLGLGKLFRRTGKREQAQEHLTAATAMYRDMGMTYWLERPETEMAQLG